MIALKVNPERPFVLLDDDPTGTQTVRDVPVLTTWAVEDIRWAFEQRGAGFFILTNTRSLDPDSAAQRVRSIVENVVHAAQVEGVRPVFASRGDSTLRSHFPLEVDVVRHVLARAGSAVDGIVLAPAYIEAGRVTVDGVHCLIEDGNVTPVHDTPYAEDATFGFASSALAAWVEDRSGGRIGSDDVARVDREALHRKDDVTVMDREWRVLTFDAVDDGDVNAAAQMSVRAEAGGRSFVYHVGPSFARARLGQVPTEPLSDEDLDKLVRDGAHGLIVVGSHVDLTAKQLEHLTASNVVRLFELNVDSLFESGAHSQEGDLAAVVARALQDGPVVVHTSRRLITGSDGADSLRVAREVSKALIRVTRAVLEAARPSYLVAKGGITSSDLATEAVGIRRAWVRGSLLPGLISVWSAANGEHHDMPYVVFAGNVGDQETLTAVVDRLEGARARILTMGVPA